MTFRFLLPFLLLNPIAARAAEPAEPPPLPLEKISVTADRERPLTMPSLLAARAGLLLTPGAVETVDAERYLRGRASTVEDTFALSAGVIAQSRFGSDEARLAIRGSGLQRTFHGRGLRILQDGVPLNLADGSFDMQAFEPLGAAYINVWRGANALAYGASTLGGAIDYVSRTGLHAPPALARTEAGSWNYLRASLAGGGARDAYDAYASFTYQSQDGFRRHAGQENQRLFVNAGRRLTGRSESRIYFTAVNTVSELPGSLTRAQLRSDPRQANPNNVVLDQHRDFQLLRVASKTSWFAGTTFAEFTAAWTYKDLDHPIGSVIDQSTNDLLVAATVSHAGHLAGKPHRLRTGLTFQHGTIAAANYVNVAGRRGDQTSAATQKATNLEAFAESQVELGGGLTVVLGASAASNRRKSDQTAGITPDYVLTYNRLMPKIGFRWDSPAARGQWQVYGNLSGSYEPPSFSEALTANTARRAQTATTLELGTRGAHGGLRWDLSVYDAALRHELLALDHDGNPATPASTVNADRTTHAGVEFAIELDLLGGAWNSQPANRLVLRAAWTYGRFRFDDDPRYGDNTLAGLPPHLARGELTWEGSGGWYAGPTFEWSPKRTYIDFRNTFAADPYALAGFRVGRRQNDGLSWFAELRNAFDRRYAATTGVIENANGADQAQFLPGEGRGVFGGLEYRW